MSRSEKSWGKWGGIPKVTPRKSTRRAEYPLAIKRLRIAIRKAERLGLLGSNICGSRLTFHIDLRLGAGAFVCGEETALIHSIEGRRGIPQPRPPYPAQEGLFGPLSVKNRDAMLVNLPEMLAAAQLTLEWFKRQTEKFREEITSFGNFPTLFRGIVKDGGLTFYDGRIRIVDAKGDVVASGTRSRQLCRLPGRKG